MSQKFADQRRIVHFTGRVQGVGFRYTTRQIAADFPVTGFVENLPDERVRLVCEGSPQDLDRFIEAVRTQMDYYISAVQISVEDPTGEFRGFGVRH